MPRLISRHRSQQVGGALVALAASAAMLVALPSPANAQRSQVACTITVNDDTYSTAQDTALVVPSTGVVSNDQICGTDGLVISVGQPSHGTLSNFDDASGGFTYTPDPGFTGTDTFTYVLEDVEGSPTGTVTITVTAPTTTTSPSTTVAVTSTTIAPTTTAAAPAQAVTATPTYTG